VTGIALGLGLSLSGSGGGAGFDADASALFAAMTTPPTAARKTLINTCIVSLKAAGVWTKLDAFYMTAAETSQAARLNWKAPSVATLSAVNSPTFTIDRGYQGDGVSAHLDNGVLVTAGANYSLNSASVLGWVNTSSTGNGRSEVGAGGTGTLSLNSRAGSGNPSIAINDNTGGGIAVPTSVGLTAGTRTTAANTNIYKNGVLLGAITPASTAMPTGNMTVLKNGSTNFSPRRVAAAAIGGALTDADHLAAYNALNTYLTAIGGN
jgi:hypothetical protein